MSILRCGSLTSDPLVAGLSGGTHPAHSAEGCPSDGQRGSCVAGRPTALHCGGGGRNDWRLGRSGGCDQSRLAGCSSLWKWGELVRKGMADDWDSSSQIDGAPLPSLVACRIRLLTASARGLTLFGVDPPGHQKRMQDGLQGAVGEDSFRSPASAPKLDALLGVARSIEVSAELQD